MFRALLLCPSSGTPSNCLYSIWLPYNCRVGRASSCGRFTDHSLKHVQPGNHTVTRGCKGSCRGLLMMGTTVPETCWAVSTRQSNKYKIDCASGWLFYSICETEIRCTHAATVTIRLKGFTYNKYTLYRRQALRKKQRCRYYSIAKKYQARKPEYQLWITW
jgi:hypothetical protein